MRISDWSSDVCSSDLHPGKLGTVAADVDDIMGDDEMMPRVDHCLHVVAHHAGTWWPSNESQDRSGKPVGPVPLASGHPELPSDSSSRAAGSSCSSVPATVDRKSTRLNSSH